MYIKEVCLAGEVLEIRKYFSSRYGKRIRPGPRERPTPEAVKRGNLRKQERELRRLMNANFKDRRDALITLEWRRGEAPYTSEGMQREVQKFIRKLRVRYRKKDKPLRYIYTMEVGPRGGKHVHMMLSHIDIRELGECWEGVIHAEPLWSGGQYGDIAAYFLKYALKTEAAEGRKLGKRRYTPSKNLIKPKVRKTIVRAASFRKKIRERKGWILDKTRIREGVSEDYGFPYLEYSYIRGAPPGEKRKIWPDF